jgi:DNA-binding transcriptional LysR family regulator
MDVRLFEEFIVLAQEKNFSAAVKSLYITQPTLTKHIQQLEREVGFPLFSRTTHTVQLTEGGEAILEAAQNLVNSYSRLRLRIDELKKPTAASIRIGYPHLGHSSFLKNCIADLGRNHPSIELQLSVYYNTDELLNALKMNCVDVILTLYSKSLNNPNLHAVPLFHNRMKVIMRKENPLAGNRIIALKDLAGQNLIFPDDSVSDFVYEKMRVCLKDAGVNANLSVHNMTLDSGLNMTEFNDYISVAPDCLVIPPSVDLVERKLLVDFSIDTLFVCQSSRMRTSVRILKESLMSIAQASGHVQY